MDRHFGAIAAALFGFEFWPRGRENQSASNCKIRQARNTCATCDLCGYPAITEKSPHPGGSDVAAPAASGLQLISFATTYFGRCCASLKIRPAYSPTTPNATNRIPAKKKIAAAKVANPGMG